MVSLATEALAEGAPRTGGSGKGKASPRAAQAADRVHANFLARLAANELAGYGSKLSLADAGMTRAQLVEVFHSQVLSRQVDRMARILQARGEGYHTVGSSGHEGSAALATAFRLTDMAFLHYRDAAFQIQRSKLLPGQTPGWDLLLGLVASSEEPIAGGRHKVLGSKALNIPPQTSTIASHLPKAVGAAIGIGLARKLGLEAPPLEEDGIIFCSFGDASANHSTAQGAINAACWAAFQGIPTPIVFVCEDNGFGISVRTPQGWIQAAFAGRANLRYLQCNLLDVLETHRAASEAASWVRRHRQPLFLHGNCVRLHGHAGTDVQSAYMGKEEIERTEAQDPLLHTAATLVREDALTAEEALRIYNDTGEALARLAEEAIRRPKHESAGQVMASLIPKRKEAGFAGPAPSEDDRRRLFGSDQVLMGRPQHMARLLNWALTDLMLEHGNLVVAGEDVGAKGGVYGVTMKLQQRFGRDRVIDTLLDEQSILGFGIGFALNGLLPIVEIQFLAYFHNAEDQLRGEAATLSFFSNQQYANPMIVRVPGLGYQRGFGGHFHNDNSLAVFRDLPGIIIACPSNGRDAVAMLRECARLALREQRVVVFIEPIALYMTRDLHQPGDKLWTCEYQEAHAGPGIALGEVHAEGEGRDLAILSYGNGYYLSRQAQRILRQQGHEARVIDLRWLAPLPEASLLSAVAPCAKILIVDECRRTGSQSEALMALLAERKPEAIARRLAAEDCFIALGPAATATLPSRDAIVAEALALIQS